MASFPVTSSAVPTDSDNWTVAGRTFTSRLIVGTGKYKSLEQNAAAVAASGAEIVTVAVRRVNLTDPNAPKLTDFIDPKRFTYLPNTAGCFDADSAIRTLRLAREAGLRSIAFPAISTGVYGFPAERAAGIAVATIRRHATGLEVTLVAFNAAQQRLLSEALA